MTYKQAFDKITEAYIAGRMEPYNSCGCFIGNLLNGIPDWHNIRVPHDVGYIIIKTDQSIYSRQAFQCIIEEGDGMYTPDDIVRLEFRFLTIINDHTIQHSSPWLHLDRNRLNHPNYENALFLAMESTLEMLKQIHIAKGEVIDGEATPTFSKRSLQNA